MPNLSVGVNADFTGVTYSTGRGWSGQPAWTFTPSTLQVHNGNNLIVWTLTTLNQATPPQNSVPAGYTAAFASTNGIQFKPTNPHTWTGTAPTVQTNGTITANDNFQNLAATVDFPYSTNVVLTPNAGTNGESGTFTKDPDVENVSGTIRHTRSAEAVGV